MANAIFDENYITTMLAVSMLDLATPVNIAVNPVTHAIIVELI